MGFLENHAEKKEEKKYLEKYQDRARKLGISLSEYLLLRLAIEQDKDND